MSKKALFLIDGYGLIYRSYFAFINRPLLDSEGNNVSALFGFFRTLFSLIQEHNPGYVAVVMDSIGPTFRHEQYEEYKANREKTPQDLRSQIPQVEQILQAAGLACIRQNGYEADDLIAALAQTATEDGHPCVIVSGDKDLLQLVNEQVSALRPMKGEYRFFNPDAVFEHLQIRPDQVIDYLALIGDSADNVPGVRGIGPKGAVDLLTKFGSLEGIYKNLASCTPAMRKKLEEHREMAFLSKELVTLRKDGDCAAFLLDDFSLEQVDWHKAVPFFEATGSKGLVKTALSLQSGSASAAGLPETAGMIRPSAAADAPKPGEPASGLLKKLKGKGSYKTVASIAELQEIIDAACNAKFVAFDCETDSLNDMQAQPVGFSLSWEAKKAWYIPLVAGGNAVLPADAVRIELKRLLEAADCRIIGQNIKYDYKVLSRWGVTMASIYFDTMVAAWLLDATANTYNMDALAEKYLGYQTVKFSEVVPKGFLFPDIELGKASEYAAEDADITFRLYLLFSEELEKRGLSELYSTLELPLLRVLADMELRGIAIDKAALSSLHEEFTARLDTIQQSIFGQCGHEFNINSTKQLQEVLFTERGLPVGKKTKTGYSTDTSVLEDLARIDIVPQLILEHRTLQKLKNTYIDSLPLAVDPTTGRLHTSFVQTGTATGRLSSRDPNLQNIPIRSEDGRRIRSAFIAADGWSFVSADYAQIELVVLAHLAQDPGLMEAFRTGGDVHSYTGALIFSVPQEAVTPEQRRIAKTINFGVMYGMSAFRLSRELGISRNDAATFISAYFTRYSGVKSFFDEVIATAAESGVVKTVLGHERSVPGIRSRNKTEKSGAERIVINTIIQGSAAEIIKIAMKRIDARIQAENLQAELLLQVHDELIFEVPDSELAVVRALVAEEMEQAMQLRIPLRVSVETGKRWGDLH